MTQRSRAAHARPHAPQFMMSALVSMHVAPQRVCPNGQRSTQDPAVHDSLTEQLRPHMPQWLRSVFVSTQVSLQSESPIGQLMTMSGVGTSCVGTSSAGTSGWGTSRTSIIDGASCEGPSPIASPRRTSATSGGSEPVEHAASAESAAHSGAAKERGVRKDILIEDLTVNRCASGARAVRVFTVRCRAG